MLLVATVTPIRPPIGVLAPFVLACGPFAGNITAVCAFFPFKMSSTGKPGSSADEVAQVKTKKRVRAKSTAQSSTTEIHAPALAVRCSKTRATPHFKKNDISLVSENAEELADQLPDTKAVLAVLQAQKKAHRAAAKAAAYEVKKAQQKRKRLELKAAKMSNSDLLTIFMARQQRCRSAAASQEAATSAKAGSTDEGEDNE